MIVSLVLVRIQNVGCNSPGIKALKPGDPGPGLQPWSHDPTGHQHIHCGLRCKVGPDPLGQCCGAKLFLSAPAPNKFCDKP
jgi:hypothetical protein